MLLGSLHPSSPILPFAFPVGSSLLGTRSLLSFSCIEMETHDFFEFEEHSGHALIVDRTRIHDHTAMNNCLAFFILSSLFIVLTTCRRGYCSFLPVMNLMLTLMLLLGFSISFRG